MGGSSCGLKCVPPKDMKSEPLVSVNAILFGNRFYRCSKVTVITVGPDPTGLVHLRETVTEVEITVS